MVVQSSLHKHGQLADLFYLRQKEKVTPWAPERALVRGRTRAGFAGEPVTPGPRSLPERPLWSQPAGPGAELAMLAKHVQT